MPGKTAYSFADGAIFRHGSLVGHYDPVKLTVTDLEEGLPKQIRKILQNRIDRELGTPVGKPLVEVLASRDESLPEPPQDPKLGDKTPAWVEWFRKTHPSEFGGRYQGRTYSVDSRPSAPAGGDIPSIPMDAPQEHWGVHK